MTWLNRQQSKWIQLVVALALVFPMFAVAQEGPSESETIEFISEMLSKYASNEYTTDGSNIQNDTWKFRLDGRKVVFLGKQKILWTSFGRNFQSTTEVTYASSMSEFTVVGAGRAEGDDGGPFEASITLYAYAPERVPPYRILRTSKEISYVNGELLINESKSDQAMSVQIFLTTYEASVKIAKALEHLWSLKGLQLQNDTNEIDEDLFND